MTDEFCVMEKLYKEVLINSIQTIVITLLNQTLSNLIYKDIKGIIYIYINKFLSQRIINLNYFSYVA